VSSRTVYFGNVSKVHALNTDDGSEKWSFESGETFPGFFFSKPAISGGTIYIGYFNSSSLSDSKLYAIGTSNGEEEESKTFGSVGPVVSSPTVSGGNVYFGSGDNNLYSVDTDDSSQSWKFTTGGAVQTSPAVDSGTVYFGSRDKVGKKTGVFRPEGILDSHPLPFPTVMCILGQMTAVCMQ